MAETQAWQGFAGGGPGAENGTRFSKKLIKNSKFCTNFRIFCLTIPHFCIIINTEREENNMIFDARRKTMTKKAWKEKQKAKRNMNGFNTGIRTMKSAKDYNRQFAKKEIKNAEFI
jgi:hypothetical protein